MAILVPMAFFAINKKGVLKMTNNSNINKIFNTALEEHINRIIINQLRQSGELLRAQHHFTRARSFQIDSQQEPEKYKAIK